MCKQHASHTPGDLKGLPNYEIQPRKLQDIGMCIYNHYFSRHSLAVCDRLYCSTWAWLRYTQYMHSIYDQLAACVAGIRIDTAGDTAGVASWGCHGKEPHLMGCVSVRVSKWSRNFAEASVCLCLLTREWMHVAACCK